MLVRRASLLKSMLSRLVSWLRSSWLRNIGNRYSSTNARASFRYTETPHVRCLLWPYCTSSILRPPPSIRLPIPYIVYFGSVVLANHHNHISVYFLLSIVAMATRGWHIQGPQRRRQPTNVQRCEVVVVELDFNQSRH